MEVRPVFNPLVVQHHLSKCDEKVTNFLYMKHPVGGILK